MTSTPDPTLPIPDAVAAPLTDLPICIFGEVFHVGTLDPTHRGAWSYEGEGLSVSVHPEDWEAIARLGGNPTWRLSRNDGQPMRFVDWHDTTPTQRDALLRWAHDLGWVEQRTVYRVSWYDEEWEDTLSTDYDIEPEGEEYTVETVWRPTPTFPAPRIDTDLDPTDALATLWVARQRPDLDGVWWEDLHDPVRLSCPRGVLVHDLTDYDRNRT